MTKKLFTFFLIFSFLLGVSGCQIGAPQEDPREKINLNYWRLWDDSASFKKIIEEYESQHPNITINYRKLRYDNYRDALLNAMAEDRGPDIFSIHNTWMKEYKNKISPAPEEVEMSKVKMEGTFKKEKVLVVETKKLITVSELENKFLDVVYDDVILRNDQGMEKIYGLPLSVDTLAMYYNKDLLNNAGIAEPPKYWDRNFQQAVKKITKQNNEGSIVQSGVALGGAYNIERASDLLSILMLQSGATMMTEDGSVMFHSAPTGMEGYNPGLEALEFYTDFANPGKEVYCWNHSLKNSLELFSEGKLGIMFGYAYHLPLIKARAPKLNFNVVKLPQIKGREVNFANYWVETVSQKSEHKDAAWDFIQFATEKEQVESYLKSSNKPTALRSLVNTQTEDQEIGVFAQQLLTSQSWYEGYDALAAEEALRKMIEETNARENKIDKIMTRAANKVQQTTEPKYE